MKLFISSCILTLASLVAQELKIKANSFHADEKKGVSVFEGKVHILRDKDELNAHKVTVYTDEKNQPIKYIAKGDASFTIVTKDGSVYKGKAQKVVYQPKEKEYHFFTDVYLRQLDEKKEIIGNEVVLKTIEGKAYAKGAKSEPVIMIFKMPQDEEK
ncbi:MAG: lipopolysaccharide transport periplasmic protein LptA [Helicobacteraceae bacterium]|nr:lipopolysaccharide transport periplasmic protein LptA [Candidatus Sulfurimonas ponti]MBL6972804.1 lipopolysaccharide transport periplasmic protein LptA [Sulfurimonas sp.]